MKILRMKPEVWAKALCRRVKEHPSMFTGKKGMKAFVQGGEAAEKRLKELLRKAEGN